jgi:Zn finger protein HypA/HybF involved in hydrogenase expression
MSFITSVLQCQKCKEKINVAFGIVGSTKIADWPSKCPYCQSPRLKEIKGGKTIRKP